MNRFHENRSIVPLSVGFTEKAQIGGHVIASFNDDVLFLG